MNFSYVYADDTNLPVAGRLVKILKQHALNSELENVHVWLIANKLTLNVIVDEHLVWKKQIHSISTKASRAR